MTHRDRSEYKTHSSVMAVCKSVTIPGMTGHVRRNTHVYGLALYAVGHSVKMQVRAAHLAGVLQLILAVGVLAEVVRRFVFGSEPESLVMMGIAFIALIANTTCLLLISKHREGGAHMKASWIFSANDVVINLGVITAGALVAWTGSNYPDLIIGSIAGIIVLNGARRILALKG